MAERFYLNCELKPGEIAFVEGDEAHHLAHVSRLREGDPVCLFNGNGCEYPALIRDIKKRRVSVEILDKKKVERERPSPLVIAAPLPKGDRASFLIEKLTELGVTTYVPLRTERSVVHPGAGKQEKLRRAVIEASKQCGRNVLMQVEGVTNWKDYCCSDAALGQRYIAHPGGGSIASSAEAKTFAVGPEGGWTDGELKLAVDNDWTMVDCGRRILRIETAAGYLAGLASGALS